MTSICSDKWDIKISHSKISQHILDTTDDAFFLRVSAFPALFVPKYPLCFSFKLLGGRFQSIFKPDVESFRNVYFSDFLLPIRIVELLHWSKIPNSKFIIFFCKHLIHDDLLRVNNFLASITFFEEMLKEITRLAFGLKYFSSKGWALTKNQLEHHT